MALTLSDIVVTAGLGQIFFAWTVADDLQDRGPTYTRFDVVEVHCDLSGGTSLAAATKIAEGGTDGAYWVTLEGGPFSFWFRTRDKGGNLGSFSARHDVSQFGQLEDPSGDGAWHLPPGLHIAWGVATLLETGFAVPFPTGLFARIASVNRSGSSSIATNKLYSVALRTDFPDDQLRIEPRTQSGGTTTIADVGIVPDSSYICVGH